MIKGQQGKGKAISLTPLYHFLPIHQTLRHQPDNYCKELTSAYTLHPNSNREPLVSERKLLTTKLLICVFSCIFMLYYNGVCVMSFSTLQETHMEKTRSNKTEALWKSMHMYIWAIGILNQLYMRDSYTQNEFLKK